MVVNMQKPSDAQPSGESLHCALLLDQIPPEEPLGTPLGNTLRIKQPKLDYIEGTLRGTFPVLAALVKDQGPLGGNLTVWWAAEMEGSEVVSVNLGWQKRWTPSCMTDSPLSTHLGSIPSGGVRL